MSIVPVLVTGGAGYIGSHAVWALYDSGWPVCVIDNLTTGFKFALPESVPFYEGDVEDADLLADIFRTHGIGAVMHFAGSIIVPESLENPLKYYHNNTAKSRTLIAAAIRADIRHFIFSSTAAVYGVPQTDTVTESSPTSPINPYGMSKLMTEIMLKDASQAHDFNFGALRYFNVAGADPELRTGQSTLGATHLIKVAVEAALGRRDHVTVFGTNFPTHDGTGVRDYIHVTDLAQAHVLTLAALVEQPSRNLVMNCGYSRGFSVNEVLDAVDRVTNQTIERRIEDPRLGDPPSLISDNGLIMQTLPWTPRFTDLDAIVEHAFAWERRLSEMRASD